MRNKNLWKTGKKQKKEPNKPRRNQKKIFTNKELLQYTCDSRKRYFAITGMVFVFHFRG